MKGAGGIILMVVASAFVIWGLALGASTQHETFQGQEASEQLDAAGNLVPLTGLLVGFGAFVGCLALGQVPILRRLGAAAQAGLSSWLLVVLVQGDYPNFDTVEGSGQANLGQSTLLVAGEGAPTVLLPVVVGGLVLIWGAMDGLHRSLVVRDSRPSPSQIQHALIASACLAIPVLGVLVVGALHVMLSHPATQEGAGLAYVLLPVACLGALAWLVILFMRIWHVRNVLAEPRIQPFTRESWDVFARIEWGILAAILVSAVASTALPSTDVAATAVGRTIVFTLRSHGQGLAFAIIPLIPSILTARRMRECLQDDLEATGGSTRATIGFTIAAGVSLLAAFLVAFTKLALLPWMVALVPMAVFAGIHVPARLAVPTMALAAWAFWARGNAFFALYDRTRFPTLEFATAPALLALWRFVAAVILGWLLYRWLIDVGSRERRSIAISLALTAAIGLALTVALELPLWLWDEGRVPVSKLAVGSLIQSQAFGVQVAIHGIATVGTLGAGVATARLVRPEWFRRTAKPVDAPNLPTA